jgi:hypothetical protein
MGLKKFTKKWDKVEKLAGLVESLGKAEDYEEDFKGKWRDFSEFLHTEYEDLDQETIKLIPSEEQGPQTQLNFAREFYEKYRVEIVRYGLRKIGDITEDLEDKATSLIVSGTIIPIKETDLDKSDDLESLIEDYEDKIDTLKDKLEGLSSDDQRYKEQKRTIEEYEEFIDLLKEYGDLVEHILSLTELNSYLRGGENREPNIERMRSIFFRYLDNLLEKFKGDKDKYEDNLPIIETVKALSGNRENLARYYINSILNPAEEKYQEVAEKEDLKDYVERTTNVLSPDRKKQVLKAAYILGKQKDQEKRQRNTEDRIFRLYPPEQELKAA